MADRREDQIALAERLQMLLLQDFENLFTTGAITAADRKTLSTLLQQNGWSLDPQQVPKGLRDKLTSRIDPKIFDDEDVVGKIA